MEFELNEQQKMIQDTVRRFLKKEIAPLAEEYESARKLLTKDIVKKLAPFGYGGAFVPEEVGGLGLDFISYSIMVEELSGVWGSLRTIVTTNNQASRIIALEGSKRQREKFLPGLLAMDDLCCFALTEPNVGSDSRSIETKAVRDGDYYVINGTKTLITGGSLADILVVFATVDRAKGAKGITAFMVQKNESKYHATDIPKMGMHSSVLSELSFEDCKVPLENRLGEEGEGLKIALRELNIGRITVTFSVIGLAQAALEAAIRYAKERNQFGKPIGSFQLVQEMIVNMAMKVDLARLSGYRAADLFNRGIDCRREASFAKLYSTQAMLEVIDDAIQIHGGYGYTREFPVERYYRDARHLKLAEGTIEMQKLILGRDILGLSAFV